MGRWRPIFKACTLTQLKHEISIKIQICKNFVIRINALKIIIEIFAFNFQLKVEIYIFLTIWEEALLWFLQYKYILNSYLLIAI